MSATLSKRHQARNERALQDLIKTIPGNDRCADCGARNPGWASWSNMKRNGNVNTNRTFNPQNTKPPIPLDVDEVDAVLERFIRQKYDQQLFSSGRSRPAVRTDTGSTHSSEDQPPPLPPKPGKRFGFGLRSSSSALPLQRSLPASPHSPVGSNGFSGPPSPIRVNKQSRVFGASVGGGGGELDSKLAQLRDMGSTDEKRNAQTMKGLGGNLEKTIESLVRLGEGSAPGSRSRTPNPPRHVAVSQPLPPAPSTQSTRAVNGISFAANGVSQASTATQGQQTYHTIDPPQTQTTRNFTSPNPYQQQPKSYNPFDTSIQEPTNVPLENALQGMQISQQFLFPNATGGYPSQPPPPQEARFHTMTPPVPQLPQQHIQSSSYAQQNPTFNNNYNPFYQNTQQHILASANPYLSNVQQQDTQSQYNPYQQSSAPQPFNNGYSTESPQPYSPRVGTSQQQAFQQPQFPEQPQQQQQQSTSPYAPQHSFADPTKYPMQNQQQPAQQYNQFQPQLPQFYDQSQPQPQALLTQQTGRVDKSSILALYNYPQLAPPPIPTDSNPTSSAEQALPNPPPSMKLTQRSATMPVQISSGSRNPFQAATSDLTAANGDSQGIYRHASQESVDVGGLQNGRHSPDAFASLSARFVR